MDKKVNYGCEKCHRIFKTKGGVIKHCKKNECIHKNIDNTELYKYNEYMLKYTEDKIEKLENKDNINYEINHEIKHIKKNINWFDYNNLDNYTIVYDIFDNEHYNSLEKKICDELEEFWYNIHLNKHLLEKLIGLKTIESKSSYNDKYYENEDNLHIYDESYTIDKNYDIIINIFYVCTKCDKRFKTKDSINSHLIICGKKIETNINNLDVEIYNLLEIIDNNNENIKIYMKMIINRYNRYTSINNLYTDYNKPLIEDELYIEKDTMFYLITENPPFNKLKDYNKCINGNKNIKIQYKKCNICNKKFQKQIEVLLHSIFCKKRNIKFYTSNKIKFIYHLNSILSIQIGLYLKINTLLFYFINNINVLENNVL